MRLLDYFVIIMMTLVVFGVINEKILKLPVPIGLMTLGLAASGVAITLSRVGLMNTSRLSGIVHQFDFNQFLTEGLLCFLLFAGSSHLKVHEIIKNGRAISLLSIVGTVCAVLCYGTLFFFVSRVFHLPIVYMECLLLGCVLAPTDPIAATGLLSQLGISEDILTIIEGEALFNDGIGVTLFVIISGMITGVANENPVIILVKEVGGSIIVALFLSFIFFKLLEQTRSTMYHIAISLLNVSLTYIVCEHFGFSGVIASVICGLYFSTMMEKYKVEKRTTKNYYTDFWFVLDAFLNDILYIVIGLCLLSIRPIGLTILILALIINLIARAVGVAVSTKLMGSVPDHLSLGQFTPLLTWGGLKGGLSLALVISAAHIVNQEAYDIFLSVTFITIAFTTILQGLTIPAVYTLVKDLPNQSLKERWQHFFHKKEH